MAGEIIINDTENTLGNTTNGTTITKYLGTSYILNNKSDFEPRKNL